MSGYYWENYQVEQPAIEELKKLDWNAVNGSQEELATNESSGTLGRSTRN
ncbi:MAG: hypothetical protein WD016_11130 [Balneolaceae bacterium]